MIRASLTAVLAVLAATPLAVAQTATGNMNMPGMEPGSPTAQAPRNAADTALMSGMAKMNQDMASAPETGNADQDFTAMMIPHHQGAVSMAQAELRYGHDPFLRHLAQKIIIAQKREIEEMKAWQAAHPAQ